MGKQEVIDYLFEKVRALENKLKDLDSQITTLSKERDSVARAYDSYRYTLESENQYVSQGMTVDIVQGIIQPYNFSDLPIHRATEIILKEFTRGMTSAELTQEIIKRGKIMTGPNSVTIVNNSLRRFPKLFKKEGSKWMLIIKDGEIIAA